MIKRGTIFRNLWAGYETYFVYLRQTTIERERCGDGIIIADYKRNGWEMRRGQHYKSDLETDKEHYPVVGHIDVDRLLTDAIITEIQKWKDGNNGGS